MQPCIGATISGNTEIENKATYHYDEALQTAPIFHGTASR
jgi:hypothetical protein